MDYGAHLPLVDFDGRGWRVGELTAYAHAAQRLGYRALAVNDHFRFTRPWLDGLTALASVVDASGDLRLATTVTLPVVRGAAAVAKAAAALDVLSGGRLVLGVGPGSSREDYRLAGVDFESRWALFDDALLRLRGYLRGDGAAAARLEPGPVREGGPPLLVASWGSAAGLRRAARLGDGWLASGYNTTPERVAAGRRDYGVSCSVATLWTHVTESRREAEEWTRRLATVLGRRPEDLAGRTLIGTAASGAELLGAYAAAGVDVVYLWPLDAGEEQLARVMDEVVPRVATS